MASLEDERKFVIRIIDNLKGSDEENISDLNDYLLDKKLNLKDLNNQDFDVICYALDSRASPGLLKFIINQCSYDTFNYTFYITENYRNYCTKYQNEPYDQIDYVVPLFIAIRNKHWEVVDFLLKEKKVDINYISSEQDNLVTYIYNNFKGINNEMLGLILKRGFYARGFPKELIYFLLAEEKNNNYVKTIFKRYFIDNSFILQMINISKRRTPLSDQALDNIVQKEKNKIIIDDLSYSYAINYNNFEGLILLLEYDSNPRQVIIDRIHRLDLWQYLNQFENYEKQLDFIQALIKQQLYSFNPSDLEELFSRAEHDENIRFCLGLRINRLYRMKNIDYSSKFESLLLACSKVNSIGFMDLNLSNIMSESKDFILKDKVRFKNDPVYINKLKKDIAESENPSTKKYLENKLKDIMEAEDPLSVKQIKHLDTPFFSLLINVAIKTYQFEVVYFLLKNQEIKKKINLNCPDGNGEYPLHTILIQAKNDKSALDLFHYMLEYMEQHQDQQQDQTQNQIFTLLTLALVTRKYMAIKYLLKQKDLCQWLRKKEANDFDLDGDPEFKILFQRYRQNLLGIKNPDQVKNQNEYIEQIGAEVETEPGPTHEHKSEGKKEEEKETKNNNLSNDNYDNNNQKKKRKKNKKKKNKNKNKNKNIEIPKCYPFNDLTLAYLLEEKENLLLLLEHGRSVNELDDYGYSILHFMILKDDIEMIQYLIEHTDVIMNYHRNALNRGHSALDIAGNCCGKEMITTILKCPSLDINQQEVRHEIPLFMILKNPRFTVNGIYEFIKLVLEKGSEVDVVDFQGQSALDYAIQTEYLPLVQLLCENGADPNFLDNYRKSPINYAIDKKSESIVAYLIDQGANINSMDSKGWSPLAHAIESSYFPVVKLLVDHGANVNFEINDQEDGYILKSLFMFALDHYKFKLPIVKYLLEHGVKYNFKSRNNLNHLMSKVFRGFKPGLLEYLLENYFDVKDIPMESMDTLIECSHIEDLKLLIEHGFDLERTDDQGRTLLGKTVVYQNEMIMKFLLEKGVSLQTINNNIDQLQFLFFFKEEKDQKNLTLLKLLVDHGLNINAVDREGFTLLIYALQFRKINFISPLLEWGADPNYVNRKVNPPRSIKYYNEYYNFSSNIQYYRQIKDLIKPYLNRT